jgi:hypothetical protein
MQVDPQLCRCVAAGRRKGILGAAIRPMDEALEQSYKSWLLDSIPSANEKKRPCLKAMFAM